MTDSDRLLGELKEFKENAKDEFRKLHSEISELRNDFKEVTRFKYKVGGGFAVMTVVVNIAFKMLF